MDTLVRSHISKDRKKQLRKLLIYFAEVEPLNRESINWKLQFNKNNQTYQMLISICYLILKGLLQTTSDGSTKLMDFLDEQRMCRLYENFILEYFKKEHPEVKASASQILWDTDDGYREMLPVMQSDILADGYGISAHRTTVTKDIAALQEFGMDIVTIHSTQSKYFVASRKFELPELKLLIDAVESSKFITKKKSETLIEKIHTDTCTGNCEGTVHTDDCKS